MTLDVIEQRNLLCKSDHIFGEENTVISVSRIFHAIRCILHYWNLSI